MTLLRLIIVALALLAHTPSSLAAEKRPNILFILVDDQSPFDFKFYNPNSPLQAPNIDRLAAEGMVLDGAYHMGSFSGAVCTPSRHMIMSGRTVWHLPIGPGARKHCPPNLEQNTIPAVFNRAGYATMRTCKLGNSYEAANKEFHSRARCDETRRRCKQRQRVAREQVLDYLAERETTKDARPFLIYFGFSHPHDTRDGKPELLAKYGAVNHTDPRPAVRRPMRSSRRCRRTICPRILFPTAIRGCATKSRSAASGRGATRPPSATKSAAQFACCENIDIQVGRVLEKLKAMGELDNTYIILHCRPRHGDRPPRLAGETESLRAHLARAVHRERSRHQAAGSRAQGNIYLLDTLATLCDLAGVPAPETNEGISFRPVLEGKKPTMRDVLYGAYSGGTKPGMRSVRKGDWKLIQYDVLDGKVREKQLFNLAENPDEFLAEHHDPKVTALTGITPKPEQVNLATRPAPRGKAQGNGRPSPRRDAPPR